MASCENLQVANILRLEALSIPSIYDEEIFTVMDEKAQKAAGSLNDSSGETAMVVTGCGTSGRLTFNPGV